MISGRKWGHIGYRMCRIVAVIIFIFLLLMFVFGMLHERFDYVELPNHVRLVPKGFMGNRIALADAQEKIVVDPAIMEIIWNDYYVMGRRVHHVAGNPRANYSTQFIYKVGDAAAIEYTGGDHDEYNRRVRESGLQTIRKNSSQAVEFTEKTYWDLIRDPRYRRKWYE